MSIPSTSKRCITAYIRTIAFVLYFAVSVVLIVLAWREIQTQADTTKSLEASVTAQEIRIANLVADNERLNQQISSAELEKSVSRGLPRVTGEFKSYMDYRAITNRASEQWKMQQYAKTSEKGLRMIGDRYMVAMGTYYANAVGEEYRIHLSSGQVVEVVVGDIKSDAHTDSNRQYTRSNKSIIEFIVDTAKLSEQSRKLGTIAEFKGSIVKIECVD